MKNKNIKYPNTEELVEWFYKKFDRRFREVDIEDMTMFFESLKKFDNTSDMEDFIWTVVRLTDVDDDYAVNYFTLETVFDHYVYKFNKLNKEEDNGKD